MSEGAVSIANSIAVDSEELFMEVEDGDTAGALNTITRLEKRLKDLRSELSDEPQTADVAEEEVSA